jgi:hypothetical protein
MSAYNFRPRRSEHAAAILAAGLPLRIDTDARQGTVFSGASNLSAQELASEIGLMVSELRVRSLRLRAALEEVTSALLRNVQCGFWLQAREAALDLAGLLGQARRGRLADAELCLRGANGALRLADLCWAVVR